MGNAKEENNPCVVRKQNIVLPIQTWNLGAKVDGMSQLVGTETNKL